MMLVLEFTVTKNMLTEKSALLYRSCYILSLPQVIGMLT
jgi:hypothetical protein